jgi:hypothetical protein
MKITNTCICKKCSNPTDWMIILPQHINSQSYQVHVIDRKRADYTKVDKNNYVITLRCSHCDELNSFDYEINN